MAPPVVVSAEGLVARTLQLAVADRMLTQELHDRLMVQELHDGQPVQMLGDGLGPRLVGARGRLTSGLQLLAVRADVGAIIDVEWGLLKDEKKHMQGSSIWDASLTEGMEDIQAIKIAYLHLRDNPGHYRLSDRVHYLRPRDQLGGLPCDQARKAFKAHKTRLQSLQKGRLEAGALQVLDTRLQAMAAAEKQYIQLQEQVLGRKRGSKAKAQRGARQ